MCGISCAVALRGQCKPSDHDRPSLSKAIDESLELIKHRGPDSHNHWISDHCRVALGHNRLTIIDLTASGEQPFHDPSNTIHAVVNGELYGWEAIRSQLGDEGYPFNSKCDSEIVVALYRKYGLSFLEHLRGEFVLCLYDEGTGLFLAATDRYAIKPLFYTVVDGRLLIASEAKAFLPFGWKPEWDVQSIKDNGWLGDRRSVFKGVHKLLPGHYLTCTSFDTISQQRYWDFHYKDKHLVEVRSEEEMVLAVREKLLQAVRDRLRADVPIGIFLSGGIDSSAIAGMVKHLMEKEGVELGAAPKSDLINCFSIKFMDEDLDEAPIARRTAEWLGVKKHVVEMTEEKLAEYLEDTVWHNETALTDFGTVGKYALSKLTHDQNIKVVLTGEGSDEHFAGYKELVTDFLRESDPSWPASALTEAERLSVFDDLESLPSFASSKTEAALFARRQVNNVSFVNSTQYSSLDPPLFASWTSRELGTSDPRLNAVNNTVDGLTRSLITHSWHPLHSALYIWSKSTLPNGLLTGLGDRVEMAWSLEARQPFLDHNLTEYVMGLPPSLKIRYEPTTKTFNEKWILKEAMRPFITDELYKRKKHPFSAPVKYKDGGPIHTLFEGLITKENVDNLGFLEWNACKDLVRNAIDLGERDSFKQMILVGQYVVLSKRFGVNKAEAEFE